MSQDLPQREHPSTYFVQDRSNLDEMTRLKIQDQLLTTGMGGVLSEQSNPSAFGRILDVGCGTGGWLIEIAKRYPTSQLLVGVDISKKLLDFARSEAVTQGVGDRVSFHVMDALRMLEFPGGFFDLVNHRLAVSYLRTWDWPKLLQEYMRVCRPGGTIRVTESDMTAESSSQALNQLGEFLFEAFSQAGHLFQPTRDGVTSQLGPLLSQHGFGDVHTYVHAIEYRGGTEAGKMLAEDMKQLFRNLVPFLRKWTRLPENYEEIYQQALTDMHQPGFVATWRLLTVWGTTPEVQEERTREE